MREQKENYILVKAQRTGQLFNENKKCLNVI